MKTIYHVFKPGDLVRKIAGDWIFLTEREFPKRILRDSQVVKISSVGDKWVSLSGFPPDKIPYDLFIKVPPTTTYLEPYEEHVDDSPAKGQPTAPETLNLDYEDYTLEEHQIFVIPDGFKIASITLVPIEEEDE